MGKAFQGPPSDTALARAALADAATHNATAITAVELLGYIVHSLVARRLASQGARVCPASLRARRILAREVIG